MTKLCYWNCLDSNAAKAVCFLEEVTPGWWNFNCWIFLISSSVSDGAFSYKIQLSIPGKLGRFSAAAEALKHVQLIKWTSVFKSYNCLKSEILKILEILLENNVAACSKWMQNCDIFELAKHENMSILYRIAFY